jgi:hypothetical protein
MTKEPCSVCGRREGDKELNRWGEPDMNPDVPLGPVTTCPDCGCLSCPDCQHEGDCCEKENA